MQARKLKKLLGTDTMVFQEKEHVVIQPPDSCGYLVSVHKDTLEVKQYNPEIPELDVLAKQIIPKLNTLIANGEWQEIMQGNDVLDNPIPIWHLDESNKVTKSFVESSNDFLALAHDGYRLFINQYYESLEACLTSLKIITEIGLIDTEKYISDLNDMMLFWGKTKKRKEALLLHLAEEESKIDLVG